ncbi:hypothetical protein AB6A40_007296 [Gnathostoma spinigerum]|uniref:Uncharacterized protein n=1 Tax=Gnathostoma spinigerum TaxID=75299 RepID=A0ABD6EVI7_9BILA
MDSADCPTLADISSDSNKFNDVTEWQTLPGTYEARSITDEAGITKLILRRKFDQKSPKNFEKTDENMVVDSPNSTSLEDSCSSSHLEQAQSSSSAELDETTESSLEARCPFCSSANNPIHKYSTRKGSYVWRHRCRNKRCTRFFGDVYVDRSGRIKASNEAKHSFKDSQISVGKPSISENHWSTLTQHHLS